MLFIFKPASLVKKPRINLISSHGEFAPNRKDCTMLTPIQYG